MPAASPVPQATTGAEYVDPYMVQQAAYHPPALPPNAWTGAPAASSTGQVCLPTDVTVDPSLLPQAGAWRPPGIGGVWPADEYLFDGGDHPPEVEVMRDWSVLGLDQEDTIAHYDTLSGRTEVEAANRVPIYAPRFASVRQVSGIVINQKRDRPAGIELPVALNLHEERNGATTVHQPIQAERYLGVDATQDFRENVRSAGLTGDVLLARLIGRFKAHEDFQIIRNGVFDNSEKARLATSLAAAHAWSADQAAQVTIDRVLASLAVGSSRAQSVYEYELPEGKPRLRIVKVASREQAQPGDEIEFTLRFDNVGDELIGNVTIVDNLTTRLEYVPDSAECSRNARFVTQENDGESLVLRWEIIDPLAVGEGGIIRFRCRVR